MSKLGEGAYADLWLGDALARITVTNGVQGWEAAVWSMDGESGDGHQKVWGKEIGIDMRAAMRVAENAGRSYSNDYTTVLEWVDFLSSDIAIPSPKKPPVREH
jgi:hypothetical protein